MPKQLLHRACYLVFLCLVMFFGFPAIAWAYIDPATTSYIIQIVSGLIISLSVVLGVFFRSIQMFFVTLQARIDALWVKLTSKKHRDARKKSARQNARQNGKQNGKRNAEQNAANPDRNLPKKPQASSLTLTLSLRPHQVPYSPRAATSISQKSKISANNPTEQRGLKESLNFLFAENRPFKVRLLIAALVALGISFTLILFGIVDVFITNRTIFPYPLTQILGPVLILSLIVFLVLTVVMLLPRGRVFDYIVTFFFGVLLVLYISGNFLSMNLGQLNGDSIPWDWYLDTAILNTVVCGLILLLPFVVRFFSHKVWNFMVMFVPALIVVMQAIALITSISTSGALNEAPQKVTYLSNAGLYEVAEQNNTFVFVLDRLDNRYVDQVAAADPTFFAGRLDGFTRFTNNLSLHSRTYPSVIYMLTGANYYFEVPPGDFVSKAWQDTTFLPELRQNGYQSKVYTEKNYGYFDAEDMRSGVDNVEVGAIEVNQLPALQKLVILSCYRYVPHALKPSFWISTDQFFTDIHYSGDTGAYTVDDYQFYRGLLNQQLSITDADGNFAFYHLNGSHAPYNLNDKVELVAATESSTEIQTRAAFRIVFEYLDQLKALGLYDDATIIITGDHGYISAGYTGDWRGLEEAQVTGLFVKPAGASGTPTAVSTAPVGAKNLQPTVLKAAGLEADSGALGYFDVPADSQEPRQIFYRVGESGVTVDYYLQEFSVVGDANNFRNWREVGKYPIQFWHA